MTIRQRVFQMCRIRDSQRQHHVCGFKINQLIAQRQIKELCFPTGQSSRWRIRANFLVNQNRIGIQRRKYGRLLHVGLRGCRRQRFGNRRAFTARRQRPNLFNSGALNIDREKEFTFFTKVIKSEFARDAQAGQGPVCTTGGLKDQKFAPVDTLSNSLAVVKHRCRKSSIY